MDRWTLMVMRAYLPAAYGFAICFGLLFLAFHFRDAGLGELAAPAAQLSAFALACAGALALWATGRLWRAHYGKGRLCDCGGLLGRERPGVRGQTDYRRCLACGRAVSSRFYD